MKGYAFLDSGGNLLYRTKEFIDNDCPDFVQQNQEYLIRMWRFDTDDISLMKRMAMDFQHLQLRQQIALDFFKSLNFDYQLLRSK